MMLNFTRRSMFDRFEDEPSWPETESFAKVLQKHVGKAVKWSMFAMVLARPVLSDLSSVRCKQGCSRPTIPGGQDPQRCVGKSTVFKTYVLPVCLQIFRDLPLRQHDCVYLCFMIFHSDNIIVFAYSVVVL